MFSDTAILIINGSCLGFMVLMLAVLAAGTKMKGGAGWATVILVTTTIPAYLSNLTRDFSMDTYLVWYIIGATLNLVCFPATWFFTRRQLDKSFRLTKWSLLHAVPAVISLLAIILHYAPMSPAEVEADMAIMEAGGETLAAVVNDILLFGQFFAYFAAIFIYCRKRLRYLRDNYSDSDYIEIRWTPRFLVAFFVLFLGAFTGYMINPRTDTWLFPILTSICIAYLVYIIIRHSTTNYLNRLPEVAAAPESQSATAPAMSEAQMKEISDRVTEYLQNSKAYINPEFSLPMLAVATGTSTKNLSLSINGHLHKNFFDLVNEMRVGEAKRLLAELAPEYTTGSVFSDCGFRSRSTFYAAFRKYEGMSPDHWRKNNMAVCLQDISAK